MYRYIIIGLMLLGSFLQAQNKKPLPKTKNTKAQKDTVRPDTVAAVVEEVPDSVRREFIVYSKRSKTKKHRMKLCLNLVSTDSVLNYCVNDSVLKDPEVYKILFEEKSGDTTYVLVYVQAFSKDLDKPQCGTGKEIKLFFVRWHTATNKAIVRQKYIESCMKGITNMTMAPILDWDKQSVLAISYHKGGTNFLELKFDPQNFKAGLQSASDNENK